MERTQNERGNAALVVVLAVLFMLVVGCGKLIGALSEPTTVTPYHDGTPEECASAKWWATGDAPDADDAAAWYSVHC